MSDAMWDRLIGPEANARAKREDEAQRQATADVRAKFMRDHSCHVCGAWLVEPDLHARWHGTVHAGSTVPGLVTQHKRMEGYRPKYRDEPIELRDWIGVEQLTQSPAAAEESPLRDVLAGVFINRGEGIADAYDAVDAALAKLAELHGDTEPPSTVPGVERSSPSP